MKTAWIDDSHTYQLHQNGDDLFLAEQLGLGPLTWLVRSIYQSSADHARSILRRPIFIDYELPAAEWGVLKVCAKRVRQAVYTGQVPANPSLVFGKLEVLPSGKNPMGVAVALSERASSGDRLFRSDRKIGAVLVGPQGEVLAGARHLGSINRALHAEVNLVEGFLLKEKKKFPRGCKIFTTLKPCKMCAGLLLAACEDPASLQVYYLEDDPGPLAQNTALESQTFSRALFTAVDHQKSQVFEYLDLIDFNQRLS